MFVPAGKTIQQFWYRCHVAEGPEAILGGLIASLVARRAPSQLGFVVLGGPRCLPDELLGLPQPARANGRPTE